MAVFDMLAIFTVRKNHRSCTRHCFIDATLSLGREITHASTRFEGPVYEVPHR